MMVPTSSAGGVGAGGSSDEISAGTTAAATVGRVGRGCGVGAVLAAVDRGIFFGAAGPHPVKRAVRITTTTKANCRAKNTPFPYSGDAKNSVSLSEGRKTSQSI